MQGQAFSASSDNLRGEVASEKAKNGINKKVFIVHGHNAGL